MKQLVVEESRIWVCSLISEVLVLQRLFASLDPVRRVHVNGPV